MATMDDGSRGARVLLADDDPTFLLLAGSTLEQAGFAVKTESDGTAALEAFSRFRPDVVLLDAEMPRMDGLQVCAELRGLPEAEFTPIIIITGREDDDVVSEAYTAGATDFISKPVRWELLPRRVQYALRTARAFARLQKSESMLSSAQQAAHLGNWDWNASDDSFVCSQEFIQILGEDPRSDPASLIGFAHEDDRGELLRLFSRVETEGGSFALDHRIIRPNGEERVVHDVIHVVLGVDGSIGRAWGTLQDVTDRKRAEREIWQLAHRDGLTGLANRRLLTERLNGVLRRAEGRARPVAVMYMDLDRFKRINDSFGHRLGDQLLKGVAERLVDVVRVRDWVGRGPSTAGAPDVSRLGGDEFTIVLTDLDEPGRAMQVAMRVLEALRRPFQLEDGEVQVTASIGIAVFPADGSDGDTLLQNADAAMYHAKRQGGDTFQFYTESMNAEARTKLQIEGELRRALDRQEFELHYQPKIDSTSGTLTGMEALIRWRHPERGLLPPGTFIPVAEESGLIVRLGEWVFRESCEQITRWRQDGLRPVPIAVNISGHQLRPTLVDFVIKSLEETGVDPHLLEIEVTESALIRDEVMAAQVLGRLKELGLELAMDDFGTGYSSLSFLRRYDVDCLKIDRSFVSHVTESPESAAIVSAIIEMAHRLHLRVVAEGVETEVERDFLRGVGCDQLQGYLIARPLEVATATDLLDADES